MAGKSKWTNKRTERQKENYAKARKREEERTKRANNQNVSARAHNGHSVGGYSIKKHGAEDAAKLAALNTRPMAERRVARRKLKRSHVPKAVANNEEEAA